MTPDSKIGTQQRVGTPDASAIHGQVSVSALAAGSAVWAKTSEHSWLRGDGASTYLKIDGPHPNPANDRARLWTCWTAQDVCVVKEQGNLRRRADGSYFRLGVPRRFRTAHSAMRYLDTFFPPNPGNQPTPAPADRKESNP